MIMMRVGILTDVYDFEKNKVGVAQYTKRLINAMKRLDLEDLGLDLYLIHYSRVNDDLYKNVNEIVCPLIPIIPKKVFTILAKMPKIIERYKINLIHLPAPTPFENTVFLIKNKNLKKVLTVHDLYLFFPWLRTKYPFPDILKWMHDRLWKPSLVSVKDKVDLYIAVSNNTKKDIIKYLNISEEKIKVIYEAPDDIFKPLGNKDIPTYINSPYILSNTLHEEIIISYYRLKKMGIEHKFVVFGKITERSLKTIKPLINKLKLHKDIIILGYVPEKELVRLYNCADMFVHPSWYEGFGLPVVEAMACGCPVIASNVGSLPEIVSDAGILVKPRDIEGWTNAMYTVLTDETLRRKLSKRGLKRSRMFSWEKTARETIKCYIDILE